MNSLIEKLYSQKYSYLDIRKRVFQIEQIINSKIKTGNQKDSLTNAVSPKKTQSFNKFAQFIPISQNSEISSKIKDHLKIFESVEDDELGNALQRLYLEFVNQIGTKIQCFYQERVEIITKQNLMIENNSIILFKTVHDVFVARYMENIDAIQKFFIKAIREVPNKNTLSNTRFENHIKDILENFYNENKCPSRIEKEELSKRAGITVKQLETWFNNKRTRSKDDNDNDEGIKKFLDEKMDWDTIFVSIDKGTLTSKDIYTMISRKLNCENEEENSKDVEKQQAIPPENLDEILLNENSPSAVESISTTSRKSLILRSRITKEARKLTAPYSTMTPRIKKISKHTSVETSTNNPQSPFLNQSLQTNPTFQHSVELANNYSDGLEHTITLITNEEPNLTTTSNSLKARYRPNKNYVRTNASPYLRLSSSDQSSAKGKTSEIMDNINIDLLLSTNPAIFNENQLLLHNTYNTTNNLLFHNSQQSLGEDFMNNNSIANIQLGTNYEFEKLQSNNIMIDNWLYDKGESNNNNNPFETTLSGFDVNNYYETNGIVPTDSSTTGNPLFMLPGVEGNNSIDTIHNNNITLNQSSYYFEYNFNPNWVSNEPLNMNYTFLEEDTTLSAPTNNLFSQTNYTVLGQNNISNELNAFSLTNFQEQ
uniref:HD2 n=1 Tax=Entrophospora sp. TaxID=1920922 RepID=A0A410HFG5_9GLOM|nr:HD2 [Entrophospora sp.]